MSYPLSPFVPGEVLELLEFSEEVELVVESPHPFVRHVADMLPLLPQLTGLGVADLGLVAHHAGLAAGAGTDTSHHTVTGARADGLPRHESRSTTKCTHHNDV